MKQVQKIRWLIAHEPVSLFLRTAQAFGKKISELTDGAYEVEIYTPTEYRALQLARYDFEANQDKKEIVPDPRPPEKHKVRTELNQDPMVDMEAGLLEMSQLHITELARYHSPDFFALELPFLFENHDHATRVLEGPIGQQMLADLKDRSPATGLAFTYSGGFRCVASDVEIATLDAFKGIKFATAPNPVTIDTVEAVGATPEVFTIRDFAEKLIEEGYTSDALETTIPRYLAQFKGTSKKYLTNTKHNMFLTSIIISNKFLSTLDQETRGKFEQASLYASRLERQWSVEDAETFAKDATAHQDLGITYRELTAEETDQLKSSTKHIVEKYKSFFTPNLVDGIIKS